MIPEDIVNDTNIINININNSTELITELSYDAENKTDLIQEDTVSDTNINNFTDLITELINDVENRTEAINNKINNIINEFNMTDIDSGKDKKVVEKNLQIILTSTLNQKNNEKENNISMNLGQCETILKNNIPCAVVTGAEKIITDTQSALDLLMSAKYEAGTKNIAIDKACVTEDFFILSTGVAGEILQKYINYGGRIAI